MVNETDIQCRRLNIGGEQEYRLCSVFINVPVRTLCVLTNFLHPLKYCICIQRTTIVQLSSMVTTIIRLKTRRWNPELPGLRTTDPSLLLYQRSSPFDILLKEWIQLCLQADKRIIPH